MLRMKMMAAMLLLSVVAFTAAAQENKEVKKPRVLVEYFMKGDHVSDDFAGLVRQAVIDGLNKTQRFELVDESTTLSLKQEEEHRTSEKAMADETARTQIITDGAHNYIVKGDVLLCSVSSKVKDGKKEYYCDMSYSITIIEVATSTTVASKKFDHSGGSLLTSASETADEAMTSSLTLIGSDMEDFLITEFPLEGNLIAMDYEVKKDKLTACYIELGSAVGVKEGDYFAIMVPRVRAGRATYSELGRLKVAEVVDGTLSFCKVTGKGKEILVALNAYLSLDEAIRAKQPIKVRSMKDPGPLGVGSFLDKL